MTSVTTPKAENPFTATKAESKAALSKATASTDFNSFLTLLTTQLRNQDPLNPQDSSQFVSQLATFSSVEQQIESNRLLENINGALGNDDLAAAAGAWVGREIEATTSRIAYSGEPVALVAPAGGAGRDVVIRDGRGEEVLRLSLGAAESRFSWNGRDGDGLVVPHGLYSVNVESAGADGKVVTAPLGVTSRVDEARMADGAVELVLANGARVAPSSVRAVVAPRG